MRHTISILVENEFGVLARVAGLFSGRGFNIDSLSVAKALDPSLARITLVTDGDDQIVEQIMQYKGQLEYIEKLEDICDNMVMKAFCPLADACVSPVVSSIKYFRSDYEEYFKNVPVSSV